MSHAIVRVQMPEEREYARYLAEIEIRKRQVAALQADMEELKLALGRFEAEYHARVGVLFVELDRLRLAIEEYERRIAWLRADPDADPAEVEREVARAFARRREEVRAGQEEARRYQEAHRREQQRPRLEAQAEAELGRLYRELAWRFHPDLARTEEERRRREAVMRRVNAAFQDRDLRTLQAILREEEVTDPAFEARSIGEKLVWAIREVARLDEVIAGLRAELEAITQSDTYRLWQRQAAGEGVIERLEADLTAEVAAERERLAALVGTYRHLVEERA